MGSFHGFLRIYNPRPLKKEDGGWTGFRPEDVMVETQLQFPVLQVEAGIFIALVLFIFYQMGIAIL